jgi:hypothetical protein
MGDLMAAIEPDVAGLVWFTLAWAVGCVGLFFLAGSYPLSAAPDDVRTASGVALLLANTVAAVAAILVALAIGVGGLRWTSLVVAGGMVFLFAPFVVQDLPGRLKDTRLGHLLLLAVTGAVLAGVASQGVLGRALAQTRAWLG